MPGRGIAALVGRPAGSITGCDRPVREGTKMNHSDVAADRLVGIDGRGARVTDRDSITHGGTTINYEIRRSKRRTKTIEVRVSRDGVCVYAPWAISDSEVQAFVRDRGSWILSHLARLSEIEPIRFADGETLAYLGREIPMVFETAEVSAPEVDLEGGVFKVTEPVGVGGEERVEMIGQAFLKWYHYRAGEHLVEAVDRWWPVAGHGPKSLVLIRNQRKRWGSCGVDGTLRFNWRVMMLEPDLIDYVVVHELAHLQVRNHSPDFWNLVQNFLPDVPQRRKRLRQKAIGMQL
jgi:hypothetical protein